MKRVDEDEYRSYVIARMDRLQRAAYLLCRDWHTAEDLVSVTFGKLYRNWSRAQQANSLDAYVQTILMRSWLDEVRRPWRRERITDDVPEPAAFDRSDVVDRLSLIDLLSELSPRRRAVVVLRFYFDLSVAETAERLGCSPSTVMNLSSQTLEVMRNRAAAINQMREGISS